MTLSIWRYAHLSLAVLASAFLIVLSVTGVILAYDAVDEKMPAYKVDNFEQINLAQVLPTLRENYFEVIEIKVDHNDFVMLDAMDEDGKAFQAYIDPLTGKKIGDVKPKSEFIQWITALHRSLFLKETGRAIVGVVSFLLILISLSGVLLIIKRHQGLKNFFGKVNKDFFSQYFHVVTGRWLLIPVLIVAVTGTLIFLSRMDYFKGEEQEVVHKVKDNLPAQDLKDIAFFKNTKLRSVERIEFPFIPDDEAEPFIVHLRKKTVTVNQVNGQIMAETKSPYSAVVEKFNVDLHTGRTNAIWAVVLGLASLNILFFIYSGFVIMFRRTRTKIKNKYNAKEASIVILVGSENGTTLHFANQIYQQLLNNGKKSYLTEMNRYETYPNAEHLIVMAATFGLGDAPTNANRFKTLVSEVSQPESMSYSVVGFGSKSYEDFCGFAQEVDEALAQQNWSTEQVAFQTVNDRSVDDFVKWAHLWSDSTGIALATAPAVYSSKIPGLKTFEVLEITNVTEDNQTFKVILKTSQKFTSGDLLAVYPAKDNRERFYSIGKIGNNVQLVVKLFPNGFGSEFLYNLKVGEKIQARAMENPNFHLHEKSQQIAMIANGTGIAPFLGMISENSSKKSIQLYTGFRYDNSLVKDYREFATQEMSKGHLQAFNVAFSREEEKQYVMDLIKKDDVYFADLLKSNGVIMICGALRMQKNVEAILDEITLRLNGQPLQFYADNNQILTDCY